jgi:hypothetical protein
MTERGRSLDRRDSHDEKPYCTWRAQKLGTAGAPNGRKEKFLDVRDATNVPAADWTSPSNTGCSRALTERNPSSDRRVTVRAKKMCAHFGAGVLRLYPRPSHRSVAFVRETRNVACVTFAAYTSLTRFDAQQARALFDDGKVGCKQLATCCAKRWLRHPSSTRCASSGSCARSTSSTHRANE